MFTLCNCTAHFVSHLVSGRVTMARDGSPQPQVVHAVFGSERQAGATCRSWVPCGRRTTVPCYVSPRQPKLGEVRTSPEGRASPKIRPKARSSRSSLSVKLSGEARIGYSLLHRGERSGRNVAHWIAGFPRERNPEHPRPWELRRELRSTAWPSRARAPDSRGRRTTGGRRVVLRTRECCR